MLTDPQISQQDFGQDPKMSTSVYLKNFGSTLIKQAATYVQNQDQQQMLAAMGQVKMLISHFARTVLDFRCILRYKQNLTMLLNRFLLTLQALDADPAQQDSYKTLSNLIIQIKTAFEQVNQPESVQGALLLCENIF